MSEPRDLVTITPVSNSGTQLTRRKILQRALMGLGATVTAPVIASAHPVWRHLSGSSYSQEAAATATDANWSPQVLSTKQNETLIIIAERMLPGSTKVHANRVIDLLLSADTDEHRQMFMAALAALEAEATRSFQKSLSALPEANVDRLLTTCCSLEPAHLQQDDSAAGWKLNQKIATSAPINLRDHFEYLKGWIVATYYSSETGLRELGWNDDFYFESPEPCEHPESHT